jgi:hypothetical protein
MPSSFFDFAIVGGDLSGILFGALAAKRGKRVAVIENGEGRAWERLGERMLPVANPWVYGIETSTLARGVLNDIDVFLQVRNRLIRARPSLQLLGERYRLDLDEPDNLRPEFERELREGAAVDVDWVQKLLLLDGDLTQVLDRKPLVPPDGWGEGRAVSKLVDEFPIVRESFDGSPLDRPTAMLPFLKTYYPFFTHTYASPMQAFPFLRVARGVLDGLFLVDDDEADIRNFFLEVIRRKSGMVVQDAQVSGFDVHRGRIQEILLRVGKESVGAEVVLCNMEPRRFLQLVPPEGQKEKFHQHVLMRHPAGYLYPLAIRLRSERFLEAAGNFMLFDPAWTGGPITVHVPRLQPASGTETVLLATTWVAAAEFSAQPSFLDRIDKRILDALDRVHPFLSDLTIERVRLGFDDNGLVRPGRLAAVYPLVEERNLGLNDLVLETPYKNCYMASRYLYGALGFEGAFLGARLLADRLLKS